MASLFLSLVCMDLMVLVSGCVYCAVWWFWFSRTVLMRSAVGFLCTSLSVRRWEGVVISLFQLLVPGSLSSSFSLGAGCILGLLSRDL